MSAIEQPLSPLASTASIPGVAPVALDLDALRTPVWIYDTANFRVHWANPSALALWEAESQAELVSRDFRNGMSEAIYSTLVSYLAEFESGRTITRWWQLSPRGVVKNVLCQFSGVRLDDGHLAMLCEGLAQELVTDGITGDGSALVSMYARGGSLISANPGFDALYRSSVRRIDDLFDSASQANALAELATRQGRHETDLRLRTPAGERWYQLEVRAVTDGSRAGSVIVTQLDITERKHRELRQHALARTDALTGLANRLGVREQLESLHAAGTPFALLYLDLDGFKLVNDTFGHRAGDTLLKRVAARIRETCGTGEGAARIGGDEFMLVLPGSAWAGGADGDLAARADALIAALSEPYSLADIGPVSLGVSVGIARHPHDGLDLDTLVANADVAMYAAKSRGGQQHAVFDLAMQRSVERKARLVQGLHAASREGSLALRTRPIVDLRDGGVWGVEGLVQWLHPTIGLVRTKELVGVAEECGLISRVERWMWRTAFASHRRSSSGPRTRVAVHVSGRHLAQDDFLPALIGATRNAGIAPEDVVLQLTESALAMDPAMTVRILEAVTAAGPSVAIDRFGTGHGSLLRLHELPVDTIKIDRKLTRVLEHDPAMVHCLADLARGRRITMIACGVDTPAQRDALAAAGIHLIQGALTAPRAASDA